VGVDNVGILRGDRHGDAAEVHVWDAVGHLGPGGWI
jgi:hypothetical protein